MVFKRKSIIALILAVFMMSSLVLTGCNSGKDNGAGGEKDKDIKEGKTRVVTDMAGREHTIAADVKSVYATSPVGSLLMYTLNDKKMIGLNYDLYDEEKEYTTKYYQELPNLGGWFGQGKTGNVEEIMKRNPDIIITAGLNKTSVDNAKALEKQLGIPVLSFDDSLDKLPDTYRFLGDVTGDKKRAETLAKYCDDTVTEAKEITSKIPEDQKVRVYYAEESEGLNTDPAGSDHSRLIDICGGINVADVEMSGGYGRTQVSIEQVIRWNPQLIVSCIDNGYANSDSYNKILTNPAWASIDAVKNKEVFQTPTIPFNWFDRPPSVNTIIGIKWFQNLLYPDLTNYDIKEETKEFYKLFYHCDLTDQDVDKILEKSLRTS